MGAAVTNAKLSVDERNALACQHHGLVKHIASKMVQRLPQSVELDDLINDGMLGLLDSLNRFDPARGIKFQTFAATRIRGAILDALRGQDWVSRGGRRRARDMQKAEEQLCHKLGRQPSRGEVAEHTGLTTRELDKRSWETTEGFVLSLDDPRSLADGSEERLVDTLRDVSPSVDSQVAANDRKATMLKGLETLGEREQLELTLYYYENFSIKEIASVLSVSEARVSQLHGRALKKLRELFASERDTLLH